MRTREQERMSESLKQIRAVQRTNESADYGRACLQFPVLVRTAGLCQAIAFFRSRKGAHMRYVADLAAQLRVSGLFNDKQDVLGELTNADLAGYMLLTRESLAIAAWLKRFAQSELNADPTQDAGG